MSNLLNLTPHNINIVTFSGETVTVPPTGVVARVNATPSPAGVFDSIPLARVAWGEVEGLPEPVEGTIYIVSALVRERVPHRSDVASPGDLLRDSAGAVVGCRWLVVN